MPTSCLCCHHDYSPGQQISNSPCAHNKMLNEIIKAHVHVGGTLIWTGKTWTCIYNKYLDLSITRVSITSFVLQSVSHKVWIAICTWLAAIVKTNPVAINAFVINPDLNFTFSKDEPFRAKDNVVLLFFKGSTVHYYKRNNVFFSVLYFMNINSKSTLACIFHR